MNEDIPPPVEDPGTPIGRGWIPDPRSASLLQHPAISRVVSSQH